MRVTALQKKARARAGADDGTSLMELALIAPVLALVLVGGVELGRFAYFNILASNAARAGVQYGAYSLSHAGDTTGMQNAAYNDAPNAGQAATAWGLSATAGHICKCSDGTANATCVPTTCGAGTHQIVWVTVTTSGVVTSLFSYPGLPASVNVGATAIMQVRQ